MRTFATVMTTGIFAVLMSSASFAADLVAPDALPADTPIDAGTFDWNGAYVGISGGYVDPNYDIGFLDTKRGFGKGSYLIGGTAGYNYQIDSFVLGVEGDLSYANYRGSFTNLFGFGFDGHADSSYLGTVRGRVGYTFDNVLVYGTGGVAFTDLKVQTPAGKIDKGLTGYTVGAGVEYGFSPNTTVKFEYLYADFGDQNTNLLPGNVKTSMDANIVRIGLNYKF
jgi:outer membrane immunogenic protein